MPYVTRFAALLVALTVSVFAGTPASARPVEGPQTISQAPCTSSDGWCLLFDADDPIPTIRTVDLQAPGKGKAKVTFHGTLYCFHNNATDAESFRLDSQIVSTETMAESTGPGGLRNEMTLTAGSTSDTFNLHSTRVFAVKAGLQTYNFLMHRLFMAPGVSCVVYNAAFTVQYLPANDPAIIVSQKPCHGLVIHNESDADGTDLEAAAAPPDCVGFGPKGKIPVIRSLAFDAPSAGKAEVTFHGTMLCTQDKAKPTGVSLLTRIVADDSEKVIAQGAGGLSFTLSREPHTTDSVNVASTRVVTFTKTGKKTFRFKAARGEVDGGTSCAVYNATFTVHFVPDSLKGQAFITSQSVCWDGSADTWCKALHPEDMAVAILRKISFKVPAIGGIVMHFHGTMTCANHSVGTRGVVDFVSQFLIPDGTPQVDGAGGGRAGDVIEAPTPHFTYGDTFNLASTMAGFGGAGKYVINFGVAPSRFDADTECFVFNATLTVNYRKQ